MNRNQSVRTDSPCAPLRCSPEEIVLFDGIPGFSTTARKLLPARPWGIGSPQSSAHEGYKPMSSNSALAPEPPMPLGTRSPRGTPADSSD